VSKPPAFPGDVVARIDGVTVIDERGRTRLDDVTLDVRAGEVLGIAGVEGNGQRELVEVVTGQRDPTRGAVHVGDGTRITSTRDFVDHGGAHVAEDRHHDAIALDATLFDNLALRHHARAPFQRFGFLSLRRLRALAHEIVARYDVRTPGLGVVMRQLSGGNQQKAVIGRELYDQPALLVAAQPTRGLDVGAMEFVYGEILDHRTRGGATLLLSHELEEIVSLADRVAVLSRGKVVRILAGDEVDTETIGLLMAGEDDLGEPPEPTEERVL
jgi:simple sugar transport system ATP-binding protein